MTSLLLSTLFNTAANRRFAFGVRDRTSLGKHHIQNLLFTTATAVVQCTGISWLVDSGTSMAAQSLWIALSGMAIGVLRFAAMKWWMFKAH